MEKIVLNLKKTLQLLEESLKLTRLTPEVHKQIVSTIRITSNKINELEKNRKTTLTGISLINEKIKELSFRQREIKHLLCGENTSEKSSLQREQFLNKKLLKEYEVKKIEEKTMLIL